MLTTKYIIVNIATSADSTAFTVDSVILLINPITPTVVFSIISFTVSLELWLIFNKTLKWSWQDYS